MFNFLKLEEDSFGLSISDFSLKIVKLEKSGKSFKFASWGTIDLEPGIIEDGEIKKEDEFIKSLKGLLKNINGKKIKTKNVIVSLPEKKAFLKTIKMPKMADDELKAAVMFQAENYIPMPVNETYLEFQVISSSKDDKNCTILLAGFPRKNVDQYLSVLKASGLTPIVFETESEAISRALIKKDNGAVFMVGFCRGHAIFMAHSGNSLCFSSVMSVALPDSYEKHVDAKENKSTSKSGLNDSKKKSEAPKPFLQELSNEIEKYINYYKTYINQDQKESAAQKKHQETEKILLCGKIDGMKDVLKYISSYLSVKAELADMSDIILPKPTKKTPSLTPEEKLEYAPAIGLALRDFYKQKL